MLHQGLQEEWEEEQLANLHLLLHILSDSLLVSDRVCVLLRLVLLACTTLVDWFYIQALVAHIFIELNKWVTMLHTMSFWGHLALFFHPPSECSNWNDKNFLMLTSLYLVFSASSTSCATTTRDPSPSNKLALSLPASCLPSKSRTIQPILYSTPVYDHSSSSTAEQSFTNHTLPFSTKRLRSTTTSAWAPRHSYIDSSSSATPATSSSSHYDDLSSLPKTPSVIHHSDHSDVAEQVLSSTSQSNNSYSITSHQHTSPLSLPFPPPFNLHHVEYLPSSTLTTSMNWLKTL